MEHRLASNSICTQPGVTSEAPTSVFWVLGSRCVPPHRVCAFLGIKLRINFAHARKYSTP